MAHLPRLPHHARSGQRSRICAASPEARPDILTSAMSPHLVPNPCSRGGRRAGSAPLNWQCRLPAGPNLTTNPHSTSRAARGFLHVRISYAQAPEILRLSRHSRARSTSSKAIVHSCPRRWVAGSGTFATVSFGARRCRLRTSSRRAGAVRYRANACRWRQRFSRSWQ